MEGPNVRAVRANLSELRFYPVVVIGLMKSPNGCDYGPLDTAGGFGYAAGMIKVDLTDAKDMENALKIFKRKAYPFATKSTLNSGAFEAQKEARAHVAANLTLRNKWTQRSIQVNQARTLNVRRQMAVVGSVADYMERQEFGGTVSTKAKRGRPIPTSYSAGLPMGQEPRTKMPKKANRLENIKIKYGAANARKRRRQTRQQRNLIAIKQAARTKNRFVFLELSKRQGIFKVLGTPKRPRIRMTHDLSRHTVRTPRDPWLGPSVARAQKKMPEFYVRALKYQIERHKLFR